MLHGVRDATEADISLAMSVNGQSISLPTGSDAWAAIDTGTTGVGCPADVLASIFAAIPNSAKGTGSLDGYYTFRECLYDINFQRY